MSDSTEQPEQPEPSEVVGGDPSPAVPEAGNAEQDNDEAPQTRITDALQRLPLFDDLFLRMQALNLEIVDAYMEDLEAQLLNEYIEIERTPVQSATFVAALSQLWVFGLYELLRTWRQRANEVLRFAEELFALSGADRQTRIAEQREKIKKASEAALDTMYYWKPFDLASRDEEFVSKVRSALDSTENFFRRIEALRVSLAKHEVPKSKRAFAMAPGYGRIDMSTGSIYWQIVLQDNHVDLVSRRTLANECRRIGEDRSGLILPPEIQKKASEFPQEGYGITRVAVRLDNGTEYDNVIVAWSKEIVWVGGNHDRMPFDARKVVEIRAVPAPAALRPSSNTPPADLSTEEVQENGL